MSATSSQMVQEETRHLWREGGRDRATVAKCSELVTWSKGFMGVLLSYACHSLSLEYLKGRKRKRKKSLEDKARARREKDLDVSGKGKGVKTLAQT